MTKASIIKQFKLADLIDGLDAKVIGHLDCLITGVSSIQSSQNGQITLLTNPLYRKHLSTTSASAVILREEDAKDCPVTAVISSNPYFTYAKIAEFFSKPQKEAMGIDSSAKVGEGSIIDPSAFIGPCCVIGKNVHIGPKAYIGPGCVLGDAVQIGEATHLQGNVSILQGVVIGKNTRIASGVIIGSDGFGFANHQGHWHKVPQLGSVLIGNDVDIGANTTIDRGAIDNTVIEDGVKLDNLIQVGHNVHIGAHTIIAGCVAIAGSTLIGKHCMVGGATCFAGHISIADHTIITGMTAVTKSLTEPGIYSSGIVGAVPNHEFRKNNARFHRLENLMKRIKTLESQVKELTERVKT